MDMSDLTFAVTFFDNYAATKKHEASLTLNALASRVRTTTAAEKDALPWLKFARFGVLPNPKTKSGCLRWDGNVQRLSGIVTDYDQEQLTPEQAAERLDKAGIWALIYTSPSHCDEAPRWRVGCPFRKELPPEQHYDMVARLNGLLGGTLAPESFTISQSYYFGSVNNNPAHRAIIIEGTTTLEEADELDESAIGKPNGSGNGRGNGAGGTIAAGTPEAEIGDIVAALDVIPNPVPTWDLKEGTWNQWNQIGMAVWRASGGSAEGFAAFDKWSRKWSEKYDPDETAYKWRRLHQSPPDRIGFGTLVHMARAARPGWMAPSVTQARPTIRLTGGNRPEAATAGIAAITEAPFFQRDGKLVYVQRIPMKTFTGATVLIPGVVSVPVPLLLNELGRRAVWIAYDRRLKDWKRVDVPYDVATRVTTMTNDWPFPPLRGVVSTPTMRPDGTLLTEPGYDKETGFVLFAPPRMPPVTDKPSRNDAIAALKTVNTLFDEFPFADPASRSVALSLVMSLLLRPILPVVPLHVANAPEGGTGKSYLFDIASALAFGEVCPAIARGLTPEETEKRLIGAALEGRPLIVLDNCNGELRSEFLCQAIERPIVQPRPLGTSKMPAIPNGFVCCANGNNIEIANDLVRRTLVCDLDANMEMPYMRQFQNRPVPSVLRNRGHYVAAVLTLARAYVLAGQPNRPAQLASFEVWSDIVRGALLWLGLADPIEKLTQLSVADPGRERLEAVFSAVAGVFPEDLIGISFLVPRVVEISRHDDVLRTAILAVTKSSKNDSEMVSPESLAWWLRRNAGRVGCGWKLMKGDGKGSWNLLRHREQSTGSTLPDRLSKVYHGR
jgi:putative DNA primase/helicase